MLKTVLISLIAPIVVIIFFFVALFSYIKLAGPLPFSVNSVTTNKSDVFSVNGEGKVSIKPDLAVVRVGVQTQGATVKVAQDSLNLAANKVSDAVKTLKVSPEDIQTENYNVNPNYDFQPAGQKITGYSANTNLVIKVRQIDQVNAVLDAATAAGANLVGGVTFDISDKTKAENEAREKAVADARSKAEAASKIAGFQLGKMINYYESFGAMPYYSPTISARAEGMAMVDNKATNIESGSTDVVVTVTLSYEIR